MQRNVKRNVKMKKKRKRRLKKRFFVIIGVLALAAVGLTAWAQLKDSSEAPYETEIKGISVTHNFIESGTPGRPGDERRIKYIIIHETGNQGAGANAKSHDSYIHEAAAQDPLSWHYTVDDHEIYHHMPDNEVAFNAGDNSNGGDGNKHGIGVELCVNQDGDYEKTLENGAVLTAWLLKSYGLKIEDVKKHEDFSGKKCPEQLIDSNRWDAFLDMVQRQRENM